MISKGKNLSLIPDRINNIEKITQGKYIEPIVNFKNLTITSQNNSDGWFVGMVPNLAAGVWVGNDDRSAHFRSTFYGQGATMALPIWGLFMKKCYKDPDLNVSKEYNNLNTQINDLMRIYMEGQMKVFTEKKFFPDANSTMRLTYGRVEGSSPYDGMEYLPFTTAQGILQKYIPGDADFDLPTRAQVLDRCGRWRRVCGR